MNPFKKTVSYLSDIALWIVILIPVWFFGSFFLNLFGVLSYDVPMTQDAKNVVRVELVNSADDNHPEILRTMTNEEMEQFLRDFQRLKTKRYANDPPSPYGEIMVAIYYSDGCVDRIGNVMNESFDESGNSCPAGGWYYFPDGTLEKLFKKYVN